MTNGNNVKIIFHIDMNAFFASVATILNPSLKGKAFAIGRENSFKGVISTASYEARKYGISSAMPLSTAYKILPSLIVVSPEYRHYKEYHNKFISLIKQYSDLVEVASIDEAYVDMTKKSMTMHPLEIAKEIQTRLLKEYKLPCSIGIAPTLFLAKMGSDMKKPLGITVVRKRDVKNIIYPLPVGDIYGIGKKTSPKLIEKGIKTIGDLIDEKNKELVLSIIGNRSYQYCIDHVLGNSSNEVVPNRYDNNESISTSKTYDTYLQALDDIIIELRDMAKKVHKRMVLEGYVTKTITITLRNKNFKTITRSKSLNVYTKDLYEIIDVVLDLLDDNFNNEEIRLLGVGLGNLVLESRLEPEYNLFTFESIIEKEEALKEVMNMYNAKFGENFIKKGIK